MPDSPTFVLVGHCGPDMFMLRSTIQRVVPDATIDQVNDARALDAYRTPDTVLLVNRELDGDFDTPNGIELIRTLSQADDAPTSILISNLDDAQDEAVAVGARPGFGKSQLYEATTVEILRGAVPA